jgi:hypothetical protein
MPNPQLAGDKFIQQRAVGRQQLHAQRPWPDAWVEQFTQES